MNCHQMEATLLLDHSGELGSWKRRRLRRHLARCAACRARRDDIERWMEAAGLDEAGAAMPSDTRRAIVGEGRRALAEESIRAGGGEAPARRSWALLAAAALVVVAAGLALQRPSPRSLAAVRPEPAEVDDLLAWEPEVDAILLALNAEAGLALESIGEAAGERSGEFSDADRIAQELLELEALEI
jgi:hypothetical protein